MSQDDNVVFNKHLADNATAMYGVPPQLLGSVTTTKIISPFTKRWTDMFNKYVTDTQKQLQAATKNLLLQQTKVIKTKVSHCNGGAMRKRRTQYYFDRIDKTIVVKETLLKNVYPVNIEEISPNEDGMITLNAISEQNK
jgi:hypothetical protein